MLGGATAVADLGKPDHDFVMRSWNWNTNHPAGSLMVRNLKERGAKKVAMLMQDSTFRPSPRRLCTSSPNRHRFDRG